MNKRLFIALILLVSGPVFMLAWLGMRSARDAQQEHAQAIVDFEKQTLRDYASKIATALREHRTRILPALQRVSTRKDARDLAQRDPNVRIVFARDKTGRLTIPNPEHPMTNEEKDFLRRTESLWSRTDGLFKPSEDGGTSPTDGWYTWYWQQGLQLLLWTTTKYGGIVGAELSRARFLADVLECLPSKGRVPYRGVLEDTRGEVIHQWGGFEPSPGLEPVASITLDEPFNSWRLRAYVNPKHLHLSRQGTGTVAGLGALLLAFVAVATYFAKESGRAMRDAEHRVSFVNQVSHELKTPLTNIRLYAELLEQALSDADERTQKHISIIVAESQRLSRLIANVLTFARQNKESSKLKPMPHAVDEIIRDVIAQFAPALAEKSIAIELELHAEEKRMVDRDALEQILGNLISNVEKYGVSGAWLGIQSKQNERDVSIHVRDRGPGIGKEDRTRIFTPFFRASNATTVGVSGTGIGLNLARNLARKHGGDVTLEATEKGTCFKVTLRAEQVLS